MKNTLIYINPSREFNKNTETLVKIQIENSLELGTKDILLITNFPYEFMGVKSTVVDESYFNKMSPSNTKFWAIANLFWDDLIENDLYWVHDLDCFQKEPISEFEIMEEMDGKDIGICDYGGNRQYSGGSVFFKKSARHIFMRVKEVMQEYRTGEELALSALAHNNLSFIHRGVARPEDRLIPAGFNDSESIRNRIKTIDFTYNFWHHNNLKRRYEASKKPIRTVHFDLFHNLGEEGSKLDFYSGENNLKIDFIGERLTNIFNKYGIAGSNQRTPSDQGSEPDRASQTPPSVEALAGEVRHQKYLRGGSL